METINLLKKYAYFYLSKYDSTKKNLESKLKNKVMRMKNIKLSEKKALYDNIKKIVDNLESKKIINDEYFASTKIRSLIVQGKSKIYIQNTLFKKGVTKDIANKLLINVETNNPNWEIDSAKRFAMKKKLGQYGNIKNKEKDLAVMSRAGFKYQIALIALGFD